uniref:hypothetical protein n=1 Tax=Hoylesella pleuritidis TaxID=407975 RepID=UPI000A6AA3DD|nr:hypothetical protein [Hoylesella pleuritidis]
MEAEDSSIRIPRASTVDKGCRFAASVTARYAEFLNDSATVKETSDLYTNRMFLKYDIPYVDKFIALT